MSLKFIDPSVRITGFNRSSKCNMLGFSH